MENNVYSVEDMIRAFGIYLAPDLDARAFETVSMFETPKRRMTERELDEMADAYNTKQRAIIEQWMKEIDDTK